MLNFRKTFEFLFKSFDISWDTKMIEKMEQEWTRFLMVIKRHWLYTIINSWRALFVMILVFFNTYLLLFYDWLEHNINSYIIAILLLINVFYWLVVVVNYITKYYYLQWSRPYIENIYSCIKKNKESDIIFTSFFNQTIFVLIFLVLIALYTAFTSGVALLNGKDLSSWINIINTLLIFIQIGLFYWYLNIMINTEMDYKVIIPGKILSFNQRWVFWDTQSMNSEKIKTMNTKYPSFLSSFLNYGNVIVLSEWDINLKGEMIIDYVGDPVWSVKEMEKILRNDLVLIEKEVNVLLKKLEFEIWISNISTPENKKRLQTYVLENETKMKEIFNKADEETKKELRELYILIQD
jgi:hypothetical protein